MDTTLLDSPPTMTPRMSPGHTHDEKGVRSSHSCGIPTRSPPTSTRSTHPATDDARLKRATTTSVTRMPGETLTIVTLRVSATGCSIVRRE